MVVWSAGRPRSMSNSSTSRYESENRRYQRTAQTIISGSKCRHLNSAGRGLIMDTAAYQTRSLGFCNTAEIYAQIDSLALKRADDRTTEFADWDRDKPVA